MEEHTTGSPRPIRHPGVQRHRAGSPYASPSGTPPGSRRPSHDGSSTKLPSSALPVNVGGQAPDCAICASPMVDPAVGGGCAHHFCKECYVEWSVRKASCPTCRAPVWSIVIDYEFARMCGAAMTPSEARDESKQPSTGEVKNMPPGCITANVQYPAGLTLRTVEHGDGDSAKGCMVVKVIKGNGAHQAGLRAGDLIVMVNGTECRDHETAVTWIDARGRVGDCSITFRPDPMRKHATMHATNLMRAVAAPFIGQPSQQPWFQQRRVSAAQDRTRGSPLVPPLNEPGPTSGAHPAGSSAAADDEDLNNPIHATPPASPLPVPPGDAA